MIKTILITLVSLLIATSYNAQSSKEHGGEFIISSNENCLSPLHREQIKLELKQNIKTLKQQGKLITAKKPIPQFIWPIAQAAGFNYERVWSIGSHVDHNSSTPNQLLDYNCGSRTYDTQSGYNHQGIDIGLWPFSWNQFQDGQAEIVAADAGTIIQKHDGNFDMSCSFNNNQWNAVYIQHSDGSIAWYGHMKNGSLTSKNIGATVSAGEYLGKVGSSGNSTGPHLHLEIYDSGSNLIDPFNGSCNSLNTTSWWANQMPYVNPYINALMSHHQPPQFNSCPTLSTIYDTNFFMPNSAVILASYFTDQISGTTANYKLFNPSNNLVSTWNKNFTNDYYSSYWYWTFNNLSDIGVWTLEVTYQGQVATHNFTIGTTTNISNNDTSPFTISPNPFKDHLVFNGDHITNCTIAIYDLTGKKLIEKKLTTKIVNTDHLAKGIYIAKVYSNKNEIILTEKVVKN